VRNNIFKYSKKRGAVEFHLKLSFLTNRVRKLLVFPLVFTCNWAINCLLILFKKNIGQKFTFSRFQGA